MVTKTKLTVSLPPEIVEVLKQLAARDGSSISDALKRSVEVRKFFVDNVDRGAEIVVDDGDETARKIVGFI